MMAERPVVINRSGKREARRKNFPQNHVPNNVAFACSGAAHFTGISISILTAKPRSTQKEKLFPLGVLCGSAVKTAQEFCHRIDKTLSLLFDYAS